MIDNSKNSSGSSLGKTIAQAGVCSRRNAVFMIKQGYVTVNDQVVHEPAYVVAESDQIAVKGKPVVRERKIYVLLNKPKGYITTVADEHNRNTVLDLLGSKVAQRIYPVGRLDRDTTGLLLITNDGDVAQRLSHPRQQIQKTYHVTLHRPLEPEHLKAIWNGIMLEDGKVVVDEIKYMMGKPRTQVIVTIHSGKNRIVRRIFEHFGYGVIKLDRFKYANLTKRGLSVGSWRFLNRQEITALASIDLLPAQPRAKKTTPTKQLTNKTVS